MVLGPILKRARGLRQDNRAGKRFQRTLTAAEANPAGLSSEARLVREDEGAGLARENF